MRKASTSEMEAATLKPANSYKLRTKDIN